MNNENLTLHFKVKDFNAWQTSYNGNEENRTSAASRKAKCFAAPTTRTMCCFPGCRRRIEGPHLVRLSEMKWMDGKERRAGLPASIGAAA